MRRIRQICSPCTRYRWLVAICVLALVVLAQNSVDAERYLWGGLMYVLAAAGALVGLQAPPETELSPSSIVIKGTFWSILAIVLAGVAFVLLGENCFTLRGTIPWLLALACLAVPLFRGIKVSRGLFTTRSARWYGVALLLITALGAVYRFYILNALPSEMGCDVPHVYKNIAQILSGEYPIFFTSYPGREGLFFYLSAPIAAILGQSFYAIKFSSALLGTLTIPLVYWVGRELWNRRAGLIAALMLAVSHWHILMSRSGLRAITLPLVWLICWGALLRAWRTNSRRWYIVSGLALGLGFYTYNAWMVAPLILLVWLAVEAIKGNGVRLREHRAGFLLCVIAALVVMTPLLSYIADDPAQYFYRTATRVTSTERSLSGNLLAVFGQNMLNALLMFNVHGDTVYVANLPYLRQLGFLTAALFLLGLVLLVHNWRKGQNAWVLVAGFGLSGPSMMALAFPNEVPNAIRAIGACPPALLIAAYGLDLLLANALSVADTGLARTWRLVAVGAVLAGLAGYEAVDTCDICFSRYPLAVPYDNYSISLDMATTIAEHSGQGTVIIWPYWYDGNAVACQLDAMGYDTFDETRQLDAAACAQDDSLYLLHPDDIASLQLLESCGDLRIIEHLDYEGNIAFLAVYGDS